MPIYAYRCSACGHAQDVLRKVSDPPLQTCPACGAPTFVKQVTAAGFQLKGSGWYVTDFRDANSKKPGKAANGEAAANEGGEPAAVGDSTAAKSSDAPSSDAKPSSAAAGKPAVAAPAPAAAPAVAPASDKGRA
ncbi:MAG: zinc ribbon domain-containing protein [Rhizobacter sp.]|nr:zinc ribbon domain-containing protein [Rhizobacter sp.]